MNLRPATIHRKLPEQLAITVAFLAILAVCAFAIDADVPGLIANTDQMVDLLQRLAQPDWNYLPRVLPALFETIQMAFAGTALGVAFAVPVAFLATAEMSGSRVVTAICRGILNIIRTIPDLLLGAIFVAVFGVGPFTGMLALAVFTFGMVSKLVYESIDTIDPGPIEAYRALGATRSHVAVHAVFPQIRTNVLSYTLYALEINVRASTVLGYIGAGGIGVMLQASMSLTRYDRVSVVLLAILVVVLAIDLASSWARRRLL